MTLRDLLSDLDVPTSFLIFTSAQTLNLLAACSTTLAILFASYTRNLLVFSWLISWLVSSLAVVILSLRIFWRARTTGDKISRAQLAATRTGNLFASTAAYALGCLLFFTVPVPNGWAHMNGYIIESIHLRLAWWFWMGIAGHCFHWSLVWMNIFVAEWGPSFDQDRSISL